MGKRWLQFEWLKQNGRQTFEHQIVGYQKPIIIQILYSKKYGIQIFPALGPHCIRNTEMGYFEQSLGTILSVPLQYAN